jgi:hypothetical protein
MTGLALDLWNKIKCWVIVSVGKIASARGKGKGICFTTYRAALSRFVVTKR